jgi:hypothetical protein
VVAVNGVAIARWDLDSHLRSRDQFHAAQANALNKSDRTTPGSPPDRGQIK